MIRRPPRSTPLYSSAASDVYKRQIVNSYPRKLPKAFAFYGDVVIGPSFFIWYLKNKIDKSFIKKFRVLDSNMNQKFIKDGMEDCRGCAAKIPQSILNKSLRSAQLENFATSPEDSVEIYKNKQDIILQSCLLYTSDAADE